MTRSTSFDVLVLGGGSAGCVLAARLSEDGRRVCLIEAGPDYGPYAEGRWPEDMLDGRRLAFSHAWETEREDRSQLRARIIGGCSAHNACVVLAGAPADYLDPARGRENLTIVADTLVDRVLLDRDRAVGVATSAGELRAEAVVLAAGAYGSPGILLRSGVGPERELPVGEGLCDHVGVGFGFEGTELLQREAAGFEQSHPLFMAQASVAIPSSFCAEGLWDLFFFPGIDPPGGRGYEVSVAVFAMKPDSRGSVRLISRDPRAPLAIDHGFLSDGRDAEVLAEGVEALRQLTGSDPIRSYGGREVRPGRDVDPLTHVRETARGFFHPVATCAIGQVVDGGGRVYGLDGLYVADASIMPTIPRTNTNLSALAVAERLAESIGGSPPP